MIFPIIRDKIFFFARASHISSPLMGVSIKSGKGRVLNFLLRSEIFYMIVA